MTSTNTRHNRWGMRSSRTSQCLVKTEESRQLTVARNSQIAPRHSAQNIALERPPKGTTTPNAIAIIAIIQKASLVSVERKFILTRRSRRSSFYSQHLTRVSIQECGL